MAGFVGPLEKANVEDVVALRGDCASVLSPRILHSAIWTGVEMFVWGGIGGYYRLATWPTRSWVDAACA
jgi:hypothetical protein